MHKKRNNPLSTEQERFGNHEPNNRECASCENKERRNYRHQSINFFVDILPLGNVQELSEYGLLRFNKEKLFMASTYVDHTFH